MTNRHQFPFRGLSVVFGIAIVIVVMPFFGLISWEVCLILHLGLAMEAAYWLLNGPL